MGLESSLSACDEPSKRVELDASLTGEVQAGEAAGQVPAGEVSGGEVDESRSQLESVEAKRLINLTNLSAPVEVIFTGYGSKCLCRERSGSWQGVRLFIS